MRDLPSASSVAEEESTPVDSVLAQLAHAPERLAPGKLGPQPGERLGPYEVKALLGQGGMGLVYQAWDTRLQRMVALKLLKVRDDTLQQRLLHEARAVSAIRHPGIGTLYSVEEVEGWAFLTLELVEGESLHHLLHRRRLTVPEVTGLARRMAEVLSAAHAAGVVHGDFKPGNVMVQPDGRVKLLDFGLAHFIRPSDAVERPADWLPTGGTPLYMSPEQKARGWVGPTADVFSLGLVLLEMLLGRLPEGEREQSGGEQVLTAHTRGQLAKAGVPCALVQVLIGCLWTAPEARYQSGGEVLAALGEERAGRASGGLALRGLGLGLVLAAVGSALWRWGMSSAASVSLAR